MLLFGGLTALVPIHFHCTEKCSQDNVLVLLNNFFIRDCFVVFQCFLSNELKMYSTHAHIQIVIYMYTTIHKFGFSMFFLKKLIILFSKDALY